MILDNSTPFVLYSEIAKNLNISGYPLWLHREDDTLEKIESVQLCSRGIEVRLLKGNKWLGLTKSDKVFNELPDDYYSKKKVKARRVTPKTLIEKPKKTRTKKGG